MKKKFLERVEEDFFFDFLYFSKVNIFSKPILLLLSVVRSFIHSITYLIQKQIFLFKGLLRVDRHRLNFR